ncbi:MAG: LAGLIDADG family homing endonuclease [bacterium]|nr:LAGLIDADG family homing endonuclease [bacterium]
MPRKWTQAEAGGKYQELFQLYVTENKTIGDIGKMLGLSGSTVYDRLIRLGIPTLRTKKPRCNNTRTDITLPERYSEDLAEFFGIMLGDGKLTKTQVMVTLGTKEMAYAEWICKLFQIIFSVRPKISFRKTGHKVVYFGSVTASRWLMNEGLVFNKVLLQVNAPRWIFRKRSYMVKFLRGFFDTDGSVYKLRWGIQLSFTNRSAPLLKSIHGMLAKVGYHPSAISGGRIYLTRREDILDFFQNVDPKNPKHKERFEKILNNTPFVYKTGASHSGNCSRL